MSSKGDRSAERWAGLARLGVVFVLLASALACAYEPKPVVFESGAESAITRDGLRRTLDRRLGGCFLRLGARFDAYDAIAVEPVTISYRTPPRRMSSFDRRKGNYALGPQARDLLERVVHQAVERGVTSSGVYALAPEPGPGVLQLRPHIVNLVYDLKPLRGLEEEFVLNAGEMTLLLEVLDVQSGERLVVFADRQRIKPAGASVQGYRSNNVTTWTGIRDVTSSWATELAGELRDLRAASPIQIEAAAP